MALIDKAIEEFSKGTHPLTFFRVLPSLKRLATDTKTKKKLNDLKKSLSEKSVFESIEILDSNKAIHYMIKSGKNDGTIIKVPKNKLKEELT